VPLFYKLAETFLPYYSIDLPHRILEDAARVEQAFAQLADEESRQELLGVLRWSLDLDFAGAPPRPIGEQYFPPDLRSLSPEEVFFDCGAFDGDTVQAFVSRSGGAFRQIVAFEPVLENFERLARRVASMDASVRERVILRRLAVGEQAGRLSFSSAGASSTAAEPASGAADVECAALDALGDLPRPTYVKLDVEGMELEALRGARKVIRGAGPALAVCAYHRLEHLWEVPLAIRELRVDYAVHLRRYAERPWELVVYAVPLLRREGACP